MKSPRFSITVHPDLGEAVEMRRQSLQYRSLAEYFVSLARTDVASQPEHASAIQWAAMPPQFRDEIDAKLLAIQRQEAGQRREKKAANPTVEISDDVLDLLANYAREKGLPLEQAANEVLARWLYQGATIG